jgi:hypothetical protein
LPSGAKDRRLYADQATMELVRHSVAEEMYLCPAVREHVPGGDALADKELQDHAQAEQLMKDLEGCPPDDPEFDRLVGMLMSEIRAHVADEEQNLFPRLRAPCPPEALDGLGDDGKPVALTSTVEELTGNPARPFAVWATDHAADFTTP